MARDLIKSADISDNTITNAKLEDNAVTANELASNAVTNAKILNGAVDNSKISDLAGSKLTGSITTATLPGANVTGSITVATIPGANVSGTVSSASSANVVSDTGGCGWQNMVHSSLPNILRNGGFDEDSANPPTGWTDVSGGTFSITVSGDGGSPAYLSSRPQSGPGRSRRLLRTSGSTNTVLRQDIDFFSLGFDHRSQFVTANYMSLYASVHIRTTFPNGAPPSAFLSVTIIQDGSPVTTITSTANSDFRPWRLLSVVAEPIIPPLTTLTALVFRVELGVSGGGTNASFDPVYFDSASAFAQMINSRGFAG